MTQLNHKDNVEDVKKENELSAESQDQNFEFMTETIKERPINKRRMIMKVIFTCILGLLFGAIACFTFVFLQPYLQERMHPVDNTKVVTFEKEEEEKLSQDDVEIKDEEEKIEETVSSDTTGPSRKDENSNDNKVDKQDENTDDKLIVKEEPKQEIINQVVETVEKDLEIEDYTKLYQQISDVATEAKRAMVTVTGVSADTDWFMNTYENKHTTAGLIVADNGKELLILARTSVIKDSDSIVVTFGDGARLKAYIKKSDPNIDISAVAVDLEKISSSTKETYKMAELGSTKSSNINGMPVIAIGSPLGIADSMAQGQITSHSFVKDMVDTSVSMITTDIYGSTMASGVIINMSGKVLGLISQDGTSVDTKNLIRGYAISDLKDKIEKISNGQEIAYLGIYGTDVTEEATKEYGVPQGAYVRQVVVDSPAMEAGIQNGDVIVKLGTTEITSFSDYKEAMLKCQPEDLMMVTVKRLGRNEYVELSYEITLGRLSN